MALAAIVSATYAVAAPPLIFRQPTVNRDSIVFVFAGDLWRVPCVGGEAVRLTTIPGRKQHPAYSPDGSQIAFTSDTHNNVDVYVMPATGGEPVRLTSHPSDDIVIGWTPDGKNVLFASDRAIPTDGTRLNTVPAAGGPATEVPLPLAAAGSYSSDGRHLAYAPTSSPPAAWKHYRGGDTGRIWIADLSDSSIIKLPHGEANDFNPMWVGGIIYFLSDRDGAVTLFAYDLKTRKTRRCIDNSGLDIKSASAGPGVIVYSQFDAIRLYDLASGKVTTVDIRLTGDFAEVQPRRKSVKADDVIHGSLSPDGKEAVFEARGEIVTVPAGAGNPRDLTQSPGVAERDPAWSPDGKWIAYFSDESGEYQLNLRLTGSDEATRKIKLGHPPSFYYHPAWSPDSKHIAYSDKRDTIWVLNVADGSSVSVDTEPFMVDYGPSPTGPNSWDADPNPETYCWSPDSRWLAYSRLLNNRLSAIFIYNLQTQSKRQVTDGICDAVYPRFSDSGNYLYFAASTDSGLSADLSVYASIRPNPTYNLYLIVLDQDAPSPFGPGSEQDTNGPVTPSHSLNVKIDFDNIGQRILPLPTPARNYQWLLAGKSDTLFALENAPSYPSVETQDDPGLAECLVWKFDLAKRTEEQFADGVKVFAMDANRDKALFQKGDDWFVTGLDEPPKDGDGLLKFDGLQIPVDPRAEWRQMYHEAWRFERDFFCDPALHGLDLKAAEARYQAYLDGLASRDDLNFLFEEMLGGLASGHIYVSGGDVPQDKDDGKVGLLGADYIVDHGRYRFARIYNRGNWNPDLESPLQGPGFHVAAGDYLLAVDGRDIPGSAELYSFFQGKAGQVVTLRVGPNPDGSNARDIKVKPVENEHNLRCQAWIEDNRKIVDKLSSNRLAYVYLPDTDVSGYAAFNRYYLAQIDKQGAIIDERFNAGGSFSDYWVDRLQRKALINIANREGADYSLPGGVMDGPKVMLINEDSVSGGDVLPWLFRKADIGPLVGRRTCGAVGDLSVHQLLDGGRLPAPDTCAYGMGGAWEVENRGVAPDYEADLDPKAWRAGRDSQLEKAVQVALKFLAKHPAKPAKRPPFPNYHR